MSDRAVAAAVLLALAPVVGYVGFALAPGAAAFTVASDSMRPTIHAGSVVYVRATGDYEPGDVVTFRQGSHTVTHRIVDETDGGYVTKGDANEAPDEWRVTDEAVVGKVVFAVPFYGTVLAFVDSPVGYLIGVVVPAVTLIAVEVRTLWRRLTAE